MVQWYDDWLESVLVDSYASKATPGVRVRATVSVTAVRSTDWFVVRIAVRFRVRVRC